MTLLLMGLGLFVAGMVTEGPLSYAAVAIGGVFTMLGAMSLVGMGMRR